MSKLYKEINFFLNEIIDLCEDKNASKACIKNKATYALVRVQKKIFEYDEELKDIKKYLTN